MQKKRDDEYDKTQAAATAMPANHPRLRAMLEAPIAPLLARMGW
jgi:hypothetical protein